MAELADLIREFNLAVKARLVEAGWRKRSGDIYTREVAPGYLAWLGLNRATKYGPPFGVNPVCGVCADELEKLVFALQALEPQKYVTPTLCRPVGYLTPANTYLELKVDRENLVTMADEISDLVVAYGLPFAESHSSLESILDGLRRGLSPRQHEHERTAVVLALLGRSEEAAREAAEALEELGSRTDPAAENLRAFVQRFEVWAQSC